METCFDPGDEVQGKINGDAFDLMQQHSGEHIVERSCP